MPSKFTISSITLGLLAGSALAAPAQPQGFSVVARWEDNGRGSSLDKRADESSATKSVVVDFTFGGQKIPVALDSGSTFTYVASTLITNKSETAGLPALFNPNTSTTYHDENNAKVRRKPCRRLSID